MISIRHSQPEAPFSVELADVLIVGSGVAGLSAALETSRLASGARVVLLTQDTIGGHGASPLAQGGIAAALDPSDSPSLHARDTELAASGLARGDLVEILTREGPDRVRDLIDLGANFDLDPSGSPALGLEGAHSRRRIVHADGDRTGAEVTRTLADAVRGSVSIETVERVRAIELFQLDGTVRGLWVRGRNGALRLFRAPATILATGGPGRVYLRTTAPPGLDGDGMAMAARAGATLRDLEFVQFHPTALNVAADPLPLITEALRGAGAKLVDRRGERILEGQGGELAPRDRVARAIWLRIQDGDEVFLDARHVLAPSAGTRFPSVLQLCRGHGIDPTRDPIPVTPAAHYHMGGIAVDRDGRSSLRGLWAIGEAASSGVHGANRLASNSLLEAMVFGPRAARAVADDAFRNPGMAPDERREATEEARRLSGVGHLPDAVVQRIRTLLWTRVGVVRSEEGMTAAIEELDAIKERVATGNGPILLAARMITRAALLRRHSVGSHYRTDAPHEPEGELRHSLVRIDPDDPSRILAGFEGDRAVPVSAVSPA